MITRRSAIGLLASAGPASLISLQGAAPARQSSPNPSPNPALAPGAPLSPERMALIEAFKKKSAGLEHKYEARTHKSDWVMPYRLFRPPGGSKAPLVVYLHGSGGLGHDNEKQLRLGNVFGTRVWLLPEVQKDFSCYVLAPQTDRGWVRYDPETFTKGEAKMIPGLGDGNRLALEIVDALLREFSIDERRVYLTGQSMGGAGVWNMTAHRQNFFAAAVPCCGSISLDDPAESVGTPVWAFHGDSDQTVPVATSRERIAALRQAGATPLYTEYQGVDHNVWEWAFTEPELVKWIFAQHRG